MASFVLRIATLPTSPLSVKKPSSAELTTRGNRPFQVRCKRDSEFEAPKTLSLTRRDAMLCFTALSAVGIAVSSPGIAEARITKAEIKRKIREKLQKLREKAGLSKKNENDKGKLSPIPPPSAKKDNNHTIEPPPLPIPDPPQNLNKTLVEATFL